MKQVKRNKNCYMSNNAWNIAYLILNLVSCLKSYNYVQILSPLDTASNTEHL